MMQFEKLVLEAEEGIAFQITEGDRKQFVIKASTIDNAHNDTFSANYANPSIPDGYMYVGGEWNNGFVIESKVNGSQFVWVLVGSLDGHTRIKHYKSVKKYGGYYISRYNISKSEEEKPQSVKGVFPWVDISHNEARKIASTMEISNFFPSSNYKKYTQFSKKLLTISKKYGLIVHIK